MYFSLLQKKKHGLKTSLKCLKDIKKHWGCLTWKEKTRKELQGVPSLLGPEKQDWCYSPTSPTASEEPDSRSFRVGLEQGKADWLRVKETICSSYSSTNGKREASAPALEFSTSYWKHNRLLKHCWGDLGQERGGRFRDPRVLAGSRTQIICSQECHFPHSTVRSKWLLIFQRQSLHPYIPHTHPTQHLSHRSVIIYLEVSGQY